MLKKAPNIRDLFQRLKDIDNQWEDIGKALKIPCKDLDDIRHSPSESDASKLFKVLRIWEATSEPHLVTWEVVIAAIEGPIVNNKTKADDIRRYLIFSKCMLLSLFYNT